MADKNHTHEVTRGSINLLISCLSQPGWTKKTQDLFAAGLLLEELDDQFGADKQPQLEEKNPSAETVSEHEAEVKAWALRSVELQLSEKQREAAKTALNHFVGQGQISPTRHFRVIGEALGLE